MAYKSKNFKKFVATAATATLVATAMAPFASAATDVPANSKYASAVEFLASKGVKGFADGTFRPQLNITRTDAAVMLVNVLGLDLESASASGFTDVPARAVKHVNALKAAGITQGAGGGKFNAHANITRGELAVWIQKGFELTSELTSVAFKDVAGQYTTAVAALVENGVTFGKSNDTFGTHDNATRGEFALFLQRANDAIQISKEPIVTGVSAVNGTVTVTLTEAVEEVSVEDFQVTQSINGGEATAVTPLKAELAEDGKTVTLTVAEVAQTDTEQSVVYTVNNVAAEAFTVEAEAVEIASVTAINATTVELTGSNLEQLKADNFSVEGNKVTSYNVDDETGKASLTFENKFESAKEQTLKLTEKVEGEADKVSEFKFTYTLEIKSVVANALTVDDDTAGQKLSFKLNGETVDADVEYLKASGYTVEFQATAGVFVGKDTNSTNSSTGELATDLTKNTKFDYKVVVSDKEGKEVAESALVEVKVVDKSEIVTSIDKFDITNGTIKLSSNTVALNDGETFAIKNIIGNKADGKKEVDITTLVEFDSSNEDVALVESGTIKPIKAGTTTITIKSGDVTKSFTLTVASEARVAKTATLTNSSLKLIESGDTASVGVVVKDQYGDVFEGLDLSKATYEISKVTVDDASKEIVTVTSTTTTDKEGKASLTVAPEVAGTGTVKVKVGNNVLATLDVSVSKDKTVAERKLELVDSSKDKNLDIYTGETVDNSVELSYNKYNASGYLLGKETSIGETGTTYTVSVEEASGKDIIDASVSSGVITVTAKADTGTAYLVIKEGSVVREKLEITVVDSTPTISAITLKSAEKVTKATNITADFVISLKEDIANKDKAVQDITLSTTSSKAVRLASNGTLYLDADKDGEYDTNELIVGTVTVTENIPGVVSGTSIATAAGDKGNVVYSVKDVSGKVIATSVVDVEVPATE